MRALPICVMCAIYASGMATAQGAEIPEVPRIDSVVLTKPQPHETSEAVLMKKRRITQNPVAGCTRNRHSVVRANLCSACMKKAAEA
jgi:hypothetical protein